MDMVLAALQLFIGQAGILTTEHQRHVATGSSLLHRYRGALARVQERPGYAPIPGTGAKHQTAADQRLFQRGDNLGRIENIGRAGRPGDRVRARKVFRINQHQTRQAHVLHGPRRAADVAGVAGIDQHHSNVLQRHDESQQENQRKAYRKPLAVRHRPKPAAKPVTLHAPELS